MARWTKYSALARTESRGMHRRTDHPGPATDRRVRLTCGGLETVWIDSAARQTVADTMPAPELTAADPLPM
ncbi:hypothetical protein ACIBG0_27125 [Nocardia sp. NPDC050630]|uniref:hypothetical protein n=1 Tax=Nocardia sp. NPDC050630 TaxID=3364321 RepID=UPI0037B06E65